MLQLVGGHLLSWDGMGALVRFETTVIHLDIAHDLPEHGVFILLILFLLLLIRNLGTRNAMLSPRQTIDG